MAADVAMRLSADGEYSVRVAVDRAELEPEQLTRRTPEKPAGDSADCYRCLAGIE